MIFASKKKNIFIFRYKFNRISFLEIVIIMVEKVALVEKVSMEKEVNISLVEKPDSLT